MSTKASRWKGTLGWPVAVSPGKLRTSALTRSASAAFTGFQPTIIKETAIKPNVMGSGFEILFKVFTRAISFVEVFSVFIIFSLLSAVNEDRL